MGGGWSRAVPIPCRRCAGGAFSRVTLRAPTAPGHATRSRSCGPDRFQPAGQWRQPRPRPVDDVDQPDDERRRQHRSPTGPPRQLQRRGQHDRTAGPPIGPVSSRPTPRTPLTPSRPARPRRAARCPSERTTCPAPSPTAAGSRDWWLRRHGHRHHRAGAPRRPGRLRGHHRRPHRHRRSPTRRRRRRTSSIRHRT